MRLALKGLCIDFSSHLIELNFCSTKFHNDFKFTIIWRNFRSFYLYCNKFKLQMNFIIVVVEKSKFWSGL